MCRVLSKVKKRWECDIICSVGKFYIVYVVPLFYYHASNARNSSVQLSREIHAFPVHLCVRVAELAKLIVHTGTQERIRMRIRTRFPARNLYARAAHTGGTGRFVDSN